MNHPIVRISIGLWLTLASSMALAEGNEGFFVEQLPAGKSVTLPRPATTFIPTTGRITLTSTDMPQSLKLTPVNLANGAAASIRVAIYDKFQDRVRYVDLRPGASTLYNFHALGSIAMIPQGTAEQNVRIRIESDKPLEISR